MSRSLTRGRLLTRLGLAGVVAAAVTVAGAVPGQAASTGEIRNSGGATAVAGSYIVVLRDSAVGGRAGTAQTAVRSKAADLARSYGGAVEIVYGAALNGFAVRMPQRAAKRLAANPAVEYVEQNHLVSLPSTTETGATGEAGTTGEVGATGATGEVGATGVQTNPPSWGLDRIDQRYLPLNQRYVYPNTATNVRAYVIDTGIRMSHRDFGGRASTGIDLVDGGVADDCNGHGTAVAGVIGGALHGVAKQVRLVAVRVLNCSGSGTIAGVVGGVDWVTADHGPGQPAVANMSLGGGANTTLDTAVKNSIADGVTYTVASGSGATSACNSSPARVPEAITVSGTTQTDARMSSANYGPCLDIFAPGQSITTTWYTSDTATVTLSGGSFATAHVAGDAALVLSPSPSWTPATVSAFIFANATTGVVTNPGTGSPNRLLYVVN